MGKGVTSGGVIGERVARWRGMVKAGTVCGDCIFQNVAMPA